MKKFYVFIIVLCLISSLFSLSNEEQLILNSYTTIQNKIIVDYSKYENKIIQIWGEFKNSSSKKQVLYSNNLYTRNIIDYENGTVDINVKTHPEKSELEIKESIKNNFEKIKNLKDVEGRNILEDVILEFDEKNIQKKEGFYSYILNLRSDHQKGRLKTYLPIIKKYSNQYNISNDLVISIIKNESSFNPYSRSPVAYGLMQLVPESGGKEAYETVYGYSKILSPIELYKPSLNIILGIGYLKKLKETYFTRLKQYPDLQRICMIAAYNCGPTRLNKIIKNIDFEKTDSRKLLTYLDKHLPEETRVYLKNNIKDLTAMSEG